MPGFLAPPPSLRKWAQCRARSAPSPRACPGLVEWNGAVGRRQEACLETCGALRCSDPRQCRPLTPFICSGIVFRHSSFCSSSSTCSSGRRPSSTCCKREPRVSVSLLFAPKLHAIFTTTVLSGAEGIQERLTKLLLLLLPR